MRAKNGRVPFTRAKRWRGVTCTTRERAKREARSDNGSSRNIVATVRYEIQDSGHSSCLLAADGCRCCLKCPGVSGGRTAERKGGTNHQRRRMTARGTVIHRANLSPFVVTHPTDKSFLRVLSSASYSVILFVFLLYHVLTKNNSRSKFLLGFGLVRRLSSARDTSRCNFVCA